MKSIERTKILLRLLIEGEALIPEIAAAEPDAIKDKEYLQLTLESGYNNIRRVLLKYRHNITPFMPKSFLDRLQLKLYELERDNLPETFEEIHAGKLKIAENNNIKTFVFEFNGIYYLSNLGKLIEIVKI